ncbi:MAG TPA: hypothetical protein VLV47_01325 [Candidatus Bathyarchaeia archaeon]|nr:hypothetical protein [Candidatus Bathyarchaeia archaeon]
MFSRGIFVLLLALSLLASCSKPPNPARTASPASSIASAESPSSAAPVHALSSTANSVQSETAVVMHNVILNERPGLQLRVRWLRGQMHPTQTGVIPSFDEPSSFVLKIQAGIIATSLSDITRILNQGLLKDSRLSNVSLSADGQQLKLKGTLHKGVPLPIEMVSDVSAAPDGRIHLHMVKLRVLKLPVKGLVQSLHVNVADLIGAQGAGNVQVSGDEIYIDAEQILPAPAIRGKLTDVHIGAKTGDLVSVFGDGRPEANQVKQWRNFIRLQGGTVNLGKLTMSPADIFLIDASNDDWFTFDLTRYQEQLVNGRIQMTPQAGLRIFMPDIDKLPRTEANRHIMEEWMKDRNLPPPSALLQ